MDKLSTFILQVGFRVVKTTNQEWVPFEVKNMHVYVDQNLRILLKLREHMQSLHKNKQNN